MRLPTLCIALFAMSVVYTAAAGWDVGFPLVLSLWVMALVALTMSGLLIGSVLWGVGRATARRRRLGRRSGDFALCACIGAGMVLGLLLLRVHAWNTAAAFP